MSSTDPAAPRARILANLPLPAIPGYALRSFGDYPAPGAPAWRPELERRTLAEIFPLIPAAERPDILLCASPEYLPIPWDIHAFRGPKVLLITDWNVCLRFLPDLCGLFDWCFTDWPGYRLLRRAGVANIHHQPLFGHDPEAFRLLQPARPRDLDLSFCGNLNSGLHGERNRLLARVARWARRAGRPVHLRQAFGPDYVEILNRSRLVFNYAIRGEANMRLFEAMACGAVPLVEESNQEAAILFQEGRHYFRYAPGRLEETLEALLAEPERVAAAAEDARREVARHTRAGQYGALLDTLLREAPGLASGAGSPGSLPVTQAAAPAGPPPGSRGALAKIRVLGSGYTAREALLEIQSRAECPGLDVEALPGILFAVLDRDPQAAESVRKALDHLLGKPGLPVPIRLFLRLQLARGSRDWAACAALARECLASLPAAGPAVTSPGGALYGVLLPPVDLGKGLNSDLNKAFLADLKGEREGGGAALLAAHVRLALAEAALGSGDARAAWAEASEARGSWVSLPWPRLRLEAALAIQDPAAVREAARAWLAASPLDTAAWDQVHRAFTAQGDGAALRELLEDLKLLAGPLLGAEAEGRIDALLRAGPAAG